MIKLPWGFQAHHVKQVARLVGVSRTGSKPDIVERLNNATKDFKPLAPGTRILSIDLGIRNLAYSLLEIPKEGLDQTPSDAALALARDSKAATLVKPEVVQEMSKAKKKELQLAKKNKAGKVAKEKPPPTLPRPGVVPILCAWERLALIPKGARPKDEADFTTTTTSATKKRRTVKSEAAQELLTHQAFEDALSGDTIPIPSVTDNVPTTLVHVEDYSPPRLAELAAKLVNTRLLPLKPDIILLEQQRFRSMGGAGVFEWTLRVNTLESMLYAIFNILQQLGKWTPEGRVEAVVARNVLEFMAVYHSGGVEDASKIWNKTSPDDNKKIKKNIVGRMLRDGGGVVIEEGNELTRLTRELYMQKWNAQMTGKRTRKTADGPSDGFKKLDDLADSLLQGLAYIKWQENKDKLVNEGMESLKDQMVDELFLRFGIERN